MNTQELARAAGDALMVGFEGKEAPPQTLDKALRAGHVGGVILFSRNIDQSDDGLETLAMLNARLSAARPEGGHGPLIAVDQEGGRVRRLKHGVVPVGPMMELAEAGDPDKIASVSESLALDLAALGFNLNFAPVLDVFTNPENTVIGDRAFGTDPRQVARLAGAWTVGHYIAGVIPCGKHFPGHGDTVADSHFELPVVNHDMKRLKEIELLPFRRAIKSRIPMLMTAHILAPAIDPDHPVTLSEAGIEALLRKQMHYNGVVITDDLEMKAVSERYSVEEMIELGLKAGVDIFLICHTEDKWLRAHEHMVRLAEGSPELRQRLLQASTRVQALKAQYLKKGSYEVPEGLLGMLGGGA